MGQGGVSTGSMQGEVSEKGSREEQKRGQRVAEARQMGWREQGKVGVGESREEGTVRGEWRVGRQEREQKKQHILNTK